MWKIINAAIPIAAALSVLLAGTSPSRAADDLLKAVKDRGVLRACVAPYTPWNIKDPATNKWEGINIDLGNEIAAALNVKIQYVDTAWSTIIPSLQSGKCDVATSSLWTSPARAEAVSFTSPIGSDGIALFVPDASTAKSVDDLDKPGNVIAVLAGSADEKVMKDLFKKATVKSLVTDKFAAQILEVASGRAAAASGAHLGNLWFIHHNPSLKVKALPGVLLKKTNYAFAVPAREYFFRDFLNVVLTNLEASGRMQAIKTKWENGGQ